MTLKERDEFFILLARAMPEASVATVQNFARRIISAAGKHQRACEGDCSLRPPEGEPDYWTAMADKAEAEAAAVIAAFHAPFELACQRDPRGCTMKLAYTLASEGFERFIYPPARGFTARDMERFEMAERFRQQYEAKLAKLTIRG